jgi:murein DD-endopeptidase MepM/ murein hydrolase activator NlpD
LFLRSDHGYEQSGGTTALSFGRAIQAMPKAGLAERFHERFPDFEAVPDLGSRIGTREWYRGAATCAAMCAVVYLLSPGFERPLYGNVPTAPAGIERDQAHDQSIAPLALGATTGSRMAANNLVAPLTDTPERPSLELTATIASGNSIESALQRSGVGKNDAGRAADLIANAVALGDLKAGTRLDVLLGRRDNKSMPRPLEKLAFRARFDLGLELVRSGGMLALNKVPIAIDNTPLRIRGRAGSSLYRTARAAGVPAKAVEAFIKSIATRVPISRVGANSEFDIIVERARAETGEVQLGNLLYAGLNGGATRVQLVRWDAAGRTEWYDASGKGERKGAMSMPVAGRISSSFGLRRHPLLNFVRMHKGTDIAAPSGTPIRASADGVVTFSGRAGGYGNFVKLSHGGGLATGYGHMRSIAVRNGTRVARGQVIGYVGSTGISTGPHLHYEIYKNGAAINPRSVSFAVTQQLAGSDLREFRQKVARLMAVPIGATRAPGGSGSGR